MPPCTDEPYSFARTWIRVKWLECPTTAAERAKAFLRNHAWRGPTINESGRPRVRHDLTLQPVSPGWQLT
jgi:hypothetical protein